MNPTTELTLVGPVTAPGGSSDSPLQAAPDIEQLQKLLDAVTVCQRYACPLSAASLLRTLSHVSLLIAEQLHPSPLRPSGTDSAQSADRLERNTLE